MFDISRFFTKQHRLDRNLSLLSSQHITKLEDIRVLGHIGDLEKYSDKIEIQFANNAEQVLYDQGKIAKEKMWKYHINRYNFRDEWDLSQTNKIKIGCFGDSFTFGDGLPSNELYVNYLSDMVDARTFNIARGGSSVERMVRTFSIFTKFVEIDVAVFTFPGIHREFFVDSQGIITDLIPNCSNAHEKYMIPFYALHENYQLVKLSFNINYILDLAAERNIKVLFTSWDMPTHEVLKLIAPKNRMKEIFPNNMDVNCARDLQHPGKKSQFKHAENIAKELHDRTWI